MASLRESISKSLNTQEALLRVFSDRPLHYFLNSWGNRRYLFAQLSWRRKQMLACYLSKRSMKRTVSCEPFINNDTQRVLITGRNGLAMKLLRSHVGNCTNHLLRILVARTLRDKGYAEITEQHFIVLTYQHIFRLDIAMNELFIMCVL